MTFFNRTGRKILLTCVLLLTAIFINAEEKKVIIHPLQGLGNVDNNKRPRVPMQLPDVTIEDFILSFDNNCIGCYVILLQDDIIVYTDIVNENGEVILPEHLSGTYTLQFQLGSITFVGEIEL